MVFIHAAIRRHLLALTASAGLVALLGCGGAGAPSNASNLPPSETESQEASQVIKVSPSDQWSHVGVLVRSIALVPKGKGAEAAVQVYDGRLDTQPTNLVNPEAVSALLGKASLPPGRYDRVAIKIDANPDTLSLAPSPDAQESSSKAVAHHQIQINGPKDSSGWFELPLMPLPQELDIQADQSTAARLEVDPARSLYVVSHLAPGGAGTHEITFIPDAQTQDANPGHADSPSAGASIQALSAADASLGSHLDAGQTMLMGQYLQSTSGKYIAILQTDGNFVIYRTYPWKVLWAQAGTWNKAVLGMRLTTAGDLQIPGKVRRKVYDLSHSEYVTNFSSYDTNVFIQYYIYLKNPNGSLSIIGRSSTMVFMPAQSSQWVTIYSPVYQDIVSILWRTNTSTAAGQCALYMQDDGNLVLYETTGTWRAVWMSGTWEPQ